MRRTNLMHLLLATLAAACTEAVMPAPEPIVARVAITPPGNLALDVSGQQQLAARAFSADEVEILGRPVTWASSSEAVAIVAEGGMVAARLDGTATITATIDGVTADKEVTVRPLAPPPPAVATVVVSPAQLTLQPGAVVQLGARTWAADGTELFDRPITWVSSNDSLAVASATGRVEARRGGEVWITAMSEGKLGQARIAIEAWSEAPLTRVAGAPLPVVWWTGQITDEHGVELTRTIRVAAGQLRVDLGAQRYEQQFTLERWEQTYIILNGEPVFWGVQRKETRTFDDAGSVTPLFEGVATLSFQSTLQPGHQFSGLLTERGFDVSQQINGSGEVLALRFTR